MLIDLLLLPENLQLNHLFNKTTKLADNDWLFRLKQSNPQLSIRASEPSNIAGFNKPQVQKFLMLHKVLEANNIRSNQI